jgi:uncharacterized membrane protein YkvA (DUF1232 family)
MTPTPDPTVSPGGTQSPQPTGSLNELLAQGRLAWRLFTDPRVPMGAKLLPLLAVLYVLMPIDLMPDIVPALGQIDDLAILLLAIRAFIQLAPDEVVREGDDDVVTTSYRVKDE